MSSQGPGMPEGVGAYRGAFPILPGQYSPSHRRGYPCCPLDVHPEIAIHRAIFPLSSLSHSAQGCLCLCLCLRFSLSLFLSV